MRSISAGHLREDLYYRLRVFELNVSPLRDRPDDVEPLVRHFLDELAQKEGVRKEITPAAIEALTGYTWPGNVRDLRNVIQSAYILADETIDVDSLPEAVTLTRAVPARADEPAAGVLRVELGSSLADIERRAILATLRFCQGNKNRAAEGTRHQSQDAVQPFERVPHRRTRTGRTGRRRRRRTASGRRADRLTGGASHPSRSPRYATFSTAPEAADLTTASATEAPCVMSSNDMGYGSPPCAATAKASSAARVTSRRSASQVSAGPLVGVVGPRARGTRHEPDVVAMSLDRFNEGPPPPAQADDGRVDHSSSRPAQRANRSGESGGSGGSGGEQQELFPTRPTRPTRPT
jgi:hypothetical protein